MSGASAGTLNNINTQFISFASVSIDSGAVWTLSGATTLASRSRTLVNGGSLTILGTLNDYGTIAAGGNGIRFAPSGAGRLIAHAGAGFTGTIDGGGGTLELATGYYPAKLYALASQLTNFASVTVDSGANWKIFGAIPNAAPLIDAGLLRDGVSLATGAQLSVAGSGTVANTIGSAIVGAGTVFNGGRIAGSTYGVQFASGFANRLILAAGGTIAGTVSGGNAIGSGTVSTLELASGASIGTLSGLGSHYVNFAQIALDAGATWVLGGTNTIASGITLTETNATLTATGNLVNNGGIVLDPSTLIVGNLLGTGSVTIQAGSTLEVQGSIASTETIVFTGANAYLHLDSPNNAHGSILNFDNTDRIDLKGVDPGSVSYAAGQLNFSGAQSLPLTTPSNNQVQPIASADGALVTALCFLPDTLIQTPAGQIKVQDLQVGDAITTFGGTHRPATWIGTGAVLATRGKRGPATPVIVRKGALAPNVPTQDLRVTKGHSFLFDNVLIPVEFLVNHRSIAWDDRAQEVTVYHVELDTHNILLANGAPAESYRDDGNRWLFRNANAGWDQPAKSPCAPVLTGGPVVDAVWKRLLDRAGPRPGLPLTQAPDLHLLADGQRIDAIRRTGRALAFPLERRPTRVVLASRSAAPQELGLARDPRVLGVALRRIVLCQGNRIAATDASDDRLREGFHGFEPDLHVRWTDGAARVPPALVDGFDGPMEVTLHLAGTTTYPDDTPVSALIPRAV